MSAAFYDYVRGCTDDIPVGHTVAGMRAYRHLVYLGAAQMVEAHFPAVRHELGEDAWRTLIEGFVRQSRWSSNLYGELKDEFLAYLARESA